MSNYPDPVDEGLIEIAGAIAELTRRLAADGELCEQDRRALERLRRPVARLERWRAWDHFAAYYARSDGRLSTYGRALMERAGIAEIVPLAPDYDTPRLISFPRREDMTAG